MAWAKTLQAASFKGVTFDIQTVGDKGGRAVASHEYPYRNGTDGEDLGLHGDHISVKAIFWGDDYEDRLKVFLNTLRSPGTGVLMHPVFGEVKAALPMNWNVDHTDDEPDTAKVTIEFLDSKASDAVFTAPSPLASVDKVATAAATARNAADNGLSAFINKIKSGPLSTLGRLAAFKDKLQQSLANIRRLIDITPIKVLLSSLDYLLYPKAFMSDVRALFDGALQGLPFGGNNNSYVVAGSAAVSVLAGSGLDDFARVLAQSAPQTMTFNTVLNTTNDAVLGLDPTQSQMDAAVVLAHAQVHGAATVAEAAMMVLAGEVNTPRLSRDELEQLANQTRSAALVAINAAHAAYPAEQSAAMVASLREIAFYTQEAASALLQQRPVLTNRAAPVSGPLRLVAQALYADPARTTELAKLNRLGRQPYIDRGQTLSTYAN
jgi:prophage DNA circulation protein